MDIQDFELSFENPLLYVAGVSAFSLLVNVYFCCRGCRGSTHRRRAGGEDSVELTKFDSRPVVPESDANADGYVDADLDAVDLDAVDLEVGVDTASVEDEKNKVASNRKIKFTPATSEDSTQTEDCAFYEMMGARFSDELDYYQRMNMGKRGMIRVDANRVSDIK